MDGESGGEIGGKWVGLSGMDREGSRKGSRSGIRLGHRREVGGKWVGEHEGMWGGVVEGGGGEYEGDW